MSLPAEMREKLLPIRQTFLEAAKGIQSDSPAYGAAQRIMALTEAYEQGELGEIDGQTFKEDLHVVVMASGLTAQELQETMRKNRLQMVIIRKKI